MEELLGTILTPEMLIVAAATGAIVEAMKQALLARSRKMSKEVFETVMANGPLVIGAVLGHLVINRGGVVPPAAMGIIAGMCSRQVYDLFAPAVKKQLRGDDDAK